MQKSPETGNIEDEKKHIEEEVGHMDEDDNTQGFRIHTVQKKVYRNNNEGGYREVLEAVPQFAEITCESEEEAKKVFAKILAGLRSGWISPEKYEDLVGGTDDFQKKAQTMDDHQYIFKEGESYRDYLGRLKSEQVEESNNSTYSRLEFDPSELEKVEAEFEKSSEYSFDSFVSEKLETGALIPFGITYKNSSGRDFTITGKRVTFFAKEGSEHCYNQFFKPFREEILNKSK